MDGFQAELLSRLPLAQAALRVFGYSLDESTLDAVFSEHRGRCYESELRFAELVYLVRDALTLYQGSGNRAFTKAERADLLPVARQNVYGKLSRLPEKLSMALLAVGAQRLGELLAAAPRAVELPASLAEMRLVPIDGKKIKGAAKRLKALRDVAGSLLGGKLLVALDLSRGLAIAMQADPDGERNDVPLVPGLLEQVRELVDEAILWIADRQFGNLDVPRLLCAREGDHFLVRCVKTLRLFPDAQRPAEEFTGAAGRRVVQEWGFIGAEGDVRRRYVRRITLHRPDEEAIILITDLLDGARYPAADLLVAYQHRWGIERVFQQVTEVFSLETLIGSAPRAMIFQATLCFLLYNMIQVVRAYVAEDGEKPVERVSSEKLFWDVRDELTTWKNLGDPETAVKALAFSEGDRAATPTTMAAWLRRTLAGCWYEGYIKAPPKKKPAGTRPRATVAPGHGGHSSTWRILQAAKELRAGGQRS